MRIDLTRVPDSFKRCLPKEEREKLAGAGSIQKDVPKSYPAGQEKQLQDDIERWLHSQQIYYTRPRMDKQTTTRKGTPDFICCVERRYFAIEVKTGTNRLTFEQEREMLRIRASQGIYLIARDLDSVQKMVGHVRAQMRFIDTELKSDGVNFQKNPLE